MGGDHGAAEVVPGSLAYARANPAGHRHPRRRRGRRPLPRGHAARQRADRARPRAHRHGRAPGARPRAQEAQLDRRRHRAREVGRRRRRRHRRAHGRGHGRRQADPGHAARHRAPGARRPDDLGRADRSSCSTSAPTPTPRPRTSPSSRGWARSSPSACSAWTGRAWRCSRSARRRARATPGSSGATELLDETDLNFIGNVEGKDLTRQMADVVVCDAVLGNVVIKFFEGLSGFIFDLFRAEFCGSIRGRLAYLLMRPSIRRIRTRVRLRGRGRVAAPGRPRGRDHHPRPRASGG